MTASQEPDHRHVSNVGAPREVCFGPALHRHVLGDPLDVVSDDWRGECFHLRTRDYGQSFASVNNNQQRLVTNANKRLVASLRMPARPTFHPSLGQLFINLREAQSWTQSDAARFAKQRGLRALSRQVLIRLEAGKTKLPDRSVLEGLATLYSVNYESLAAEVVAAIAKNNYGHDLSSQAAEVVSPLHADSQGRTGNAASGNTAARAIPVRFLACFERFSRWATSGQLYTASCERASGGCSLSAWTAPLTSPRPVQWLRCLERARGLSSWLTHLSS